MKTASAAKMAAQFADYLEASQEQPVLITRNGKPVALLMAVHDKVEAEQLAVRHARTLRSVFEEAHEQLQRGEGIPHDEFWRQVEQTRRSKRSSAVGKKSASGT
jgi:prevent-host-death family protein